MCSEFEIRKPSCDVIMFNVTAFCFYKCHSSSSIFHAWLIWALRDMSSCIFKQGKIFYGVIQKRTRELALVMYFSRAYTTFMYQAIRRQLIFTPYSNHCQWLQLWTDCLSNTHKFNTCNMYFFSCTYKELLMQIY